MLRVGFDPSALGAFASRITVLGDDGFRGAASATRSLGAVAQ